MRSTSLTVSALLVSSVAAAPIPYHPLTAESITGNASTLNRRVSNLFVPNAIERVNYPAHAVMSERVRYPTQDVADEFERWSRLDFDPDRNPFSRPGPRPLQQPRPTPTLFQRLKNSLIENKMTKWISKHPKLSIFGGLSASVTIVSPIGVKVHKEKCNKLKQQRREKNFREIAEAKQGLRQTPGHHKRDLSESEEDLNIYSLRGGGGGHGGGGGRGGGGGGRGSGKSAGSGRSKSSGSGGKGDSGRVNRGYLWPYGGGGSAPPMSQEDLENKKKQAAKTAEQQYALNWDWSVPNCGSAWPF